ncbi:MAG TPA: hypothetical protein PLM22_06610 [Candidatus Sabulitectum sp.]|nr:hypothetical protein [Candidatus Sabulitectum sp.]HPF32124.1 hypothetical protein [Candidatus Sabulitectum sp.]HPJ28589.1 hypothetical protein [Candidatus Sabulitectum sp.]HPR22658.1 hypothetical protein [Candidatus Sabulitectum sp.]
MLKAEIRKTSRETVLVLSFGLLLPLVYWINEYRLSENKPFSDYLEVGAVIMAAALIARLSHSMFSAEDSQNAFEYLKTLPLPGWKLAALKILPRLVISAILISGLGGIMSPAVMPVDEAVFIAW